MNAHALICFSLVCFKKAFGCSLALLETFITFSIWSSQDSLGLFCYECWFDYEYRFDYRFDVEGWNCFEKGQNHFLWLEKGMFYLNPWVRMVFVPRRRTPAAGKFSQLSRSDSWLGRRQVSAQHFAPTAECPPLSTWLGLEAIRCLGEQCPQGSRVSKPKTGLQIQVKLGSLRKQRRRTAVEMMFVKPEHLGPLAIGVGLLPKSTGGF